MVFVIGSIAWTESSHSNYLKQKLCKVMIDDDGDHQDESSTNLTQAICLALGALHCPYMFIHVRRHWRWTHITKAKKIMECILCINEHLF